MELCGFPNQSRDYARTGQQKGSVHQRTQAENGGALSPGTLDGDSRLWVQTISADRDTASRGGDMQSVTLAPLAWLTSAFLHNMFRSIRKLLQCSFQERRVERNIFEAI